MSFSTAFTVMVYRQLKNFLRARSRVVATLIQPMMWILLFGLGMGSVLNVGGPAATFIRSVFEGLDYTTFLATGVVGMSVFLGSFMSGISILWDKQLGFLKVTLVSHAPRSAIIIGRMVGDSIVTVIQATAIILVARAISSSITLVYIPIALAYCFILSICFASIGTTIALRMRSIEGFQTIMNFIVMPVMFLSGVFYPVDRLPTWAQIIAFVNPLTYGVDGIRYWLTGASMMDPLKDLAILTIITVIFLALAIRAFENTTIES